MLTQTVTIQETTWVDYGMWDWRNKTDEWNTNSNSHLESVNSVLGERHVHWRTGDSKNWLLGLENNYKCIVESYIRFPCRFAEHLNDGQLIRDVSASIPSCLKNPFINLNQPTLREYALTRSILVQMYDFNNSIGSQIFMDKNTYGVILHVFRVDTENVSQKRLTKLKSKTQS